MQDYACKNGSTIADTNLEGSLWNFTTSSWDVLGSVTANAEANHEFFSATTTGNSPYVEPGTLKVKTRLKWTRTASDFRVFCDLVEFGFNE